MHRKTWKSGYFYHIFIKCSNIFDFREKLHKNIFDFREKNTYIHF